MELAYVTDSGAGHRGWHVLRFTARFSDGRRVQRSSSARVYTHAWLAVIRSGAETSEIHGFSISHAHAEERLEAQRRLFDRPISRVRMLRWEISDVDSELADLPPRRRRSAWR